MTLFKRTIAGVACAMALSACGTLGTTGPTQGLTVAWASLDAVAVSLDAAAKAGKLKGPNAIKAADDLERARTLLRAGDAANASGIIAGLSALAKGVQ